MDKDTRRYFVEALTAIVSGNNKYWPELNQHNKKTTNHHTKEQLEQILENNFNYLKVSSQFGSDWPIFKDMLLIADQVLTGTD